MSNFARNNRNNFGGVKVVKAKDRPHNIDEDLRRLEISMLKLWAKKYPREFRRIADEMRLELAAS